MAGSWGNRSPRPAAATPAGAFGGRCTSMPQPPPRKEHPGRTGGGDGRERKRDREGERVGIPRAFLALSGGFYGEEEERRAEESALGLRLLCAAEKGRVFFALGGGE